MSIDETKVLVYLYVAGFEEHPQKVIAALGLENEVDKIQVETWEKGDARAKGVIIKHTVNGFRLAINPDELTFDQWTEAILKLVDPKQLREVCGDCEVELSVVVYIVNDRPAIYLTKEATSLLAALGGSLDVDLYVLSDEGEKA